METEIAGAPQPPAGYKKPFYTDVSLWFLVAANLITIWFALTEHWALTEILLAYWIQSVIIGIVNVIKIATLENYSTAGFSINGRHVSPNIGTKTFTAFFFLIHYGFFHFAYLMFILALGPTFDGSPGFSDYKDLAIGTGITIPKVFPSSIDYASLAFMALTYFINHLASFLYNRKGDAEKTQNIGAVMFYPYARIIPMHLTIIFGGFISVATGNTAVVMMLFLFLKTGADAVMHVLEHK